MLGSLLNFLFAPWLPVVTIAVGVTGRLLWPLLSSLGWLLMPRRRARTYPLTRQQHVARAQAYLESLDRDAVLRLISRHCEAPATLVDQRINATGSEVLLVGQIVNRTADARQTLHVRIPLDPATYETWETVQSEVCTIEYIRAHTQIPVPTLHGHGRARLFQNCYEQQCYMIFSIDDGQEDSFPLSYERLDECGPQARKRLFEDLIGVMIQLRRLHFDAGGSLQPNHQPAAAGSSEPAVVVDRPLTRNINTINTNGFRFAPPRAESVRDYIDTQHDVLRMVHDVPVPALDADEIAVQMYALDTMRARIGAPTARPLPERFTLSLDHLDDPCDIVVDGRFHLVAIASWKWVSTCPAALATPPRWILDDKVYRADFDTVAANMKRRTGRRKLKLDLPRNDWLFRGPADVLARAAHIFQSPKALADVFLRHIHPRLSDEAEAACEERWFDEDVQRMDDFNAWSELCEGYSDQLRAQGLDYWDPNPAQILSFLLETGQVGLET